MLEIFCGNYTIKQIFKDNWSWFYDKYQDKLRESIMANVEQVMACGDKDKMGYHLYECLICGEKKYVAHTCKSRFCNSCGKIATDNWMNHTYASFLNVPYQHIIFNPPSQLWYLFAFNRQLLDLLFQVTSQAIIDWAKDQGFLPGICLVMHTFGAQLFFDPHIHMLITDGGMNLDNADWQACDYYPHQMLKSRFRTLLVKKLRHLAKDSLLSLPDALKDIWQHKYNFWGNFFALTQKLYNVIWYVHIGERLNNAYFTTRYIGRYAKRPSISETRILYYSFKEQIVVFQYKDKHTNTQHTTTISVEEFMARLIRHIPNKHFRMIRYYGIYANRVKDVYLTILTHQIIALTSLANLQFNPDVCQTASNWRARIIQSTGQDPLNCPVCNQPMQLVEVAYRTRDGPLKVVVLNQ